MPTDSKHKVISVTGGGYAAGRETIEIIIKTVIPFMAFVSMILGIISALLGAQIGMGNIPPQYALSVLFSIMFLLGNFFA